MICLQSSKNFLEKLISHKFKSFSCWYDTFSCQVMRLIIVVIRLQFSGSFLKNPIVHKFNLYLFCGENFPFQVTQVIFCCELSKFRSLFYFLWHVLNFLRFMTMRIDTIIISLFRGFEVSWFLVTFNVPNCKQRVLQN